MDSQAQQRLQSILVKDPSVLTEQEVRFLKARRGYLTQEQMRIFGSVMEGSFRGSDAVADVSHQQPAEQPSQPQPVQTPVQPTPAAQQPQVTYYQPVSQEQPVTDQELQQRYNA